jgi:hypothetical protein
VKVPHRVEDDSAESVLNSVPRWLAAMEQPQVHDVTQQRLDVLIAGDAVLPVVRVAQSAVGLNAVGVHVLAVADERRWRQEAFVVELR